MVRSAAAPVAPASSAAATASSVPPPPSATVPANPSGAAVTGVAARGLLPGAAAGLPDVPPGVPFLGHLLIADRGNNRIVEVDASGTVSWLFPSPGYALPVPFVAPDDAFYTPDGSAVVANSESNQTVTEVGVGGDRVLWQAGTPGVRGSTTNHFNWPDDAVPNADGTITVADIRNCRLVRLSATGAWLGTQGSGVCRHHPPESFASPNGAFPTLARGLVVTEISGSWVDWVDADGALAWSAHAPVRYPSDAVPYPDGSVLLTDYSLPGQALRINADGRVLWRFAPTGRQALNHPSIALPLAANRVAICDDYGNQVLIVDPSTNDVLQRITTVGGVHLHLPDGLDFRPT
ncbi:MAG: hypothetical protein ACRDHX_05230 [Chloroflexota bacterium]